LYILGPEYYIIMFHSDQSFRFPSRTLRFPVRTNIHLDAPVVVVLTERPHTVIFFFTPYLSIYILLPAYFGLRWRPQFRRVNTKYGFHRTSSSPSYSIMCVLREKYILFYCRSNTQLCLNGERERQYKLNIISIVVERRRSRLFPFIVYRPQAPHHKWIAPFPRVIIRVHRH